jgi:hypothetical protein
MESNTKVIRDFIYVDVERLYSLYSQVFEGVTDQIVKSYVDGLWQKDSQKGSILKGSSSEAQVAEVSLRTENKFLYDHMYNRLEKEISTAILEHSNITLENFREILKQVFMIKVSGTAEIEDYNRFKIFTEKFNSIAEAIAYASAHSEESKAALNALEASVTKVEDRNRQIRAKEQLKRIKDPKYLAKQMGLSQDETLLKNLRLFTETFNPEGFEITIVPAGGQGGLVFRGILDKRWLRIHSNLLRALYGAFVESNWIMVGQPTYLPGGNISELPETLSTQPGDESKIETPSMRDPFRNMFRAARFLENMFLESKQRVEVIVCPLAIYREREILISEKG